MPPSPPQHVPSNPEFRIAIKQWRQAQAEHHCAVTRLQAASPVMSPGLEALMDEVHMKGLVVDLALERVVEASRLVL